MLALACALPAQGPLLRLQPTARPGQPLSSFLLGRPLQGYATFLDLHGGPMTAFGETLYLGLSPALTLLDAGTLDPVGLQRLVLATPPNAALAGVPLFAQSLLLDAAAPNGAFRVTNGESAILHGRAAAIALRLDDAAAEGWTGTFDRTVRDRLQGVPNRVRLARVEDLGVRFGQPIATPLGSYGCRAQMVYRVTDLGASGEEEWVTGLHWRPFGTVAFTLFPRVQITLSHSHVVPDYSIDPFSALPRFPNSGLSTTFAQNYKPNQQPVVVHDGAYVVDPRAQRPDGYLPYPAIRPYPYNGLDSLLVEFRVPANGAIPPGAMIDIMVMSSPLPNARAYANGTAATPVDPFAVASGQGDNSLHHLLVQLEKVRSVATSPWLQAPAGTAAVWYPAHVAASLPAGTSVALEYRGANDAQGNGATIWLPDTLHARGKPWLQVRATLAGAPRSTLVPSIDTLVLPVD
jgi:hypothetical protein